MQTIFKFYKILFVIFLLPFSLKAQNYPLILAAKDNKTDDVKHYISRGEDVNTFDTNGYTALMYAVDNVNLSVVKMLMDAGANADVNPLYDNEPPALHTAILKNSPQTADLLLLYNQTNVNFLDNKSQSALYHAVKYGFLECADVLLYHGADANLSSEETSPLQIAAYYGDTAMINLLLKNGADINKVCQGKTALCVALSRSMLEAAKLLVIKGADTKLCNPGVYVAAYSDAKSLEYIKQLGLDLTQTEETHGYSLKDISTFTENRKNVKELKKLGVKSNKKILIRRFSISEINEFAKHEGRMGFKTAVYESNSKLSLFVATSFRPKYMLTLKQISDNYYYQLREKMTFFHAGIEKRFAFYNTEKFDIGAYLGYQFSLSSGKYDGAVDLKPKNQTFHSPSIGMYSKAGFFGLSLGYKYYPYENAIQAPKNVFSLGIDFYISRQLKGFKQYKF